MKKQRGHSKVVRQEMKSETKSEGVKRRRLIWLMVPVIAVAGLLYTLRDTPRPGAAPKIPFTDLDTALASEIRNGWQVSVPPHQKGPYRRNPNDPMPNRVPSQGTICRIRDSSGAIAEELDLKGIEGWDQEVIYLETADGKQTMAALKRPQ